VWSIAQATDRSIGYTWRTNPLVAVRRPASELSMDLILIILILLLLFGGGFGYRRYGHRGGIGIGGILLLILVLYLIFGHGRV